MSETRCPGAATAVVAMEKLHGYLLNPDPEVSGGKSAIFERLGFNASNADELAEALLTELPTATVSSRSRCGSRSGSSRRAA